MSQGPFRPLLPLVLASASPRRQVLLASQGLCFEVIPSKIKEPAPESGELPSVYAARMAEIKGRDIALKHPDKIVISADTIVVQGTNILGKPKNEADALRMLTSLSNSWHEVVTGFCILHQRKSVAISKAVTTRVHMGLNTETMLKAYIASGEPMDKAGAYGIQAIGAFLVDQVEGSYTNVVGLPLRSVLNRLLELNAIGIAPC